MGRAPCCDKANVKKGPWSPEEDAKLKSYIEQHGTGGNWIALPQKIGLKRCGKSCRLRWLNYLRPNLKHGGFSEEEDNIICSLYVSIGSRWSVIAAQLPGRTDNDIKNYWNTRLKKKLLGKHRRDQQSRCRGKQHEEANKGTTSSSTITSSNSLLLLQENITTTHQSHDQLQHHPYWPHMPVLAPLPYSHQDPCFNDQDSIKRLLIRLGGRFSDDHDHEYRPTLDLDAGFSNMVPHQFPQPVYEQVNRASSSCMSNNGNAIMNNNTQPQLSQTQLGAQETGEGGSFSAALEDIVGNAYPRRLDGMELLYDNTEDMMVSDSKIAMTPTCSTRTATNWGDTVTNSLMSYPPLVIPSNNYQGMPQECAFQELRRYHGA